MTDDSFLSPRWFVCLLACLFLPVHAGWAQEAPAGPGNYVDHTVDGPTVSIDGERADVQVTLVRPSIVRVDWRRGASEVDSSRAVIASPQEDLRLRVHEADDALYVRGTEATVIVEKSPLRIRVANEEGRAVFSEAETNVAWTDTSRGLRFRMDPDTRAYGTGERPAFGIRGHAFDLTNTQRYGYSEAPMTMKVNVPFIPTTGGYGVFIDNPYRAHLDVARTDSNAGVLHVQHRADVDTALTIRASGVRPPSE